MIGLSPADAALFREKGILHMPAVFTRRELAPLQRAVIAGLKQMESQAGALARLKKLPLFQQTGALGGKIAVEALLQPLFTQRIQTLVQALHRPLLQSTNPQLLLSLPHKQPWGLKDLNWHLDFALPEQDIVAGIQAFLLIGDIAPQGGATLALAGTHRLPYSNGTPPQPAKGILRRNRHFSALFDGAAPDMGRMAAPTLVQGVEVHVVEMQGRAGDVYLMDMRVLHSPSVNAASRPRMMATARYAGRQH